MSNKMISKELISYLIVGILSTLINFIVYYIMFFLGIDYKVSNTAAFIISVIFAFVANKKYVFLSDNSFLKEAIKFFSGRIFIYTLDIGMMIFFIEYLNTGEYMAKIWTNIFIVFANYFLSKFWIFKK